MKNNYKKKSTLEYKMLDSLKFMHNLIKYASYNNEWDWKESLSPGL